MLSSGKDYLNAPGSRFGGTPIHAAVIRRHLSIIGRLIAAGADLNQSDFNKVTPLHTAASHGDIEVMKILLEYGASKELKDGLDRRTPAEWATLGGYSAAARLLEEHSEVATRQINPYQVQNQQDEDAGSSDAASTVSVWQPSPGFSRVMTRSDRVLTVPASLVSRLETRSRILTAS